MSLYQYLLEQQSRWLNFSSEQWFLTLLVYALLGSGIAYFLIAYICFRKRRKRAALTFSLLMLASGIYSIAYFFELHSQNPAEIFLWLRLEYIGIAFIPALLTYFVLQYTDQGKWLRPFFAIGLFSIPLVTLVFVWTNELHHLFYREIQVTFAHQYAVSVLGKGPWYWLHIAYYNVFLLVSLVTLVNAALQGNRHYRRRYYLLIPALLIPWTGLIIYQTGSGPLNLDLGPFGLILAGILCAYHLILHKPFDLIPITRQNFFDNTQDGYLFLDNENRIVDLNEAVHKLLGTDDTIIGRPFWEVFRAVTDQAALPDRKETERIDGEYRLLNEKRWVEARSSSIIDQKGNFRATLVQLYEITRRRRYEQELKYRSFHDALTGIYNRAYFEDELKRLSGGREYPVTIIAADLDSLKMVNDSMGHAEGDRLLQACVEVLKASLRQSDVLARVGGDEFAVILTRTDAEAAESVRQRVKMNMDLYNREQVSFPLSISLGMASADDSGTALAELHRRADEMMYREKLSGSPKSGIVQALLDALIKRGLTSDSRIRRIESLCRLVGQKAGLSTGQLNRLTLLSRVYDLGKMGIPDAILFKNGYLTAEEREILRLYPEKGYRIASAAPHLSSVAELILKHQERWDGAGYPLGLKGEEIPLECRILAIVQTYDAIVSDRPYRKAQNKEEALAELRQNAGSQFDAKLVEIFLTVV